MNEFKINTVYYDAVNEKPPYPNKKGDYTFQPPANYGRRPFVIRDVSYAAAKRELKKFAKHGGEFYLLP